MHAPRCSSSQSHGAQSNAEQHKLQQPSTVPSAPSYFRWLPFSRGSPPASLGTESGLLFCLVVCCVPRVTHASPWSCLFQGIIEGQLHRPTLPSKPVARTIVIAIPPTSLHRIPEEAALSFNAGQRFRPLSKAGRCRADPWVGSLGNHGSPAATTSCLSNKLPIGAIHAAFPPYYRIHRQGSAIGR